MVRTVTERASAAKPERRKTGGAVEPSAARHRVSVTRAQVAAARGQVITDRRLGRPTPTWVVAMAGAVTTRAQQPADALVLRTVGIEIRDEKEIVEAHRILAELQESPAETDADLIRACDDLRLTVHSLLEVLDRPARWLPPRSSGLSRPARSSS